MVMLRDEGKAFKIAKNVLKKKGIKVREPKSEKKPLHQPYLQH